MPKFGANSLVNVNGAHAALKALMMECIKQYDFFVPDGGRGRKAQEHAFATGHSKVHFGDSAHNWIPWIALDIYPFPYNFTKAEDVIIRGRLKVLQLEVVKPTAKKLGIPLRQGIDFNMNGVLTDDNFVDLPHIELFPWREFAKHSKPYED